MNTYTTQDAFLPLLVAKEDMDKSQSYMIMAYQMSDYLFNGLIGFALKVIHPLFLIATSVASFIGSASIFNSIAIDEEIPKVDSESKIDWLEGFKLLKKYQMPALTNLGTAFGMGLITTTTMMGLNVEGAVTSALIGNLGAVIGSIVSVRLMMHATKKMYGTTEFVEVKSSVEIPENSRVVREGSAGSRFIQAILDGGKVGVDMGLSIIPGVVIICTLVIILTNGPGAEGVYTGAANEGVGILPWIGSKLSFILSPLFGFSSPEAIAVPITALGSTGAAIGTVAKMAAVGKVSGNDIAVFTAICMCWSGYISTHIAMMDALGTKEATGKALISHTIGGLVAGVAAHILYMIFHMF